VKALSDANMLQIKDIQDFLANEVEHEASDNSISSSVEEPDIVFGVSEPLSLEEACELLPSRHVADKLLSVYFSAHHLHIRMSQHYSQHLYAYSDEFSFCSQRKILERGNVSISTIGKAHR
jgi:hypothetical protein